MCESMFALSLFAHREQEAEAVRTRREESKKRTGVLEGTTDPIPPSRGEERAGISSERAKKSWHFLPLWTFSTTVNNGEKAKWM